MARRSRFVRPAKSAKTWVGIDLALTAVAGSATVLIGSLNAAALLLRPFTILRTRMAFFIESDQLAAGESSRGALGFIVVSDQAITAGTASIPKPTTQLNAKFFVWEPWINSFLLASAVGFAETGASASWIVDSKAMRKVAINEDVAIQCSNSSANGVLATLEGRMLVQLH